MAVCLSATFSIDPLQSCVCCIRSGVIPGIHFAMHCRCLLCQCGLHVVPWSLISKIMHLLAAEPHSTAWLLYPSQHLYGTILMTAYSVVSNWRVFRAGSMLLCWAALFLFVLHCFLIFYLSSMGWLCGVGVFWTYRAIIIIHYLWPLRTDVHLVVSLALTHDTNKTHSFMLGRYISIYTFLSFKSHHRYQS